VAEQLGLLFVLTAGLVYARGITRCWATAGAGRIVTRPQAACFVGAFAIALVALGPPLDDGVQTNLAWHMVQHVLLLAVVPPLLAASAPVTVALYALPAGTRRRVQPAWRGVLRAQEGRFWLAWTAGSFALANVTLALWHIPALYDAAVDHPLVHVAEHGTFLATATFFWWMALGAGRRERRGLGVLAVFIASLPATALGVLMTLASTSWYSPYGTGTDAVHDQQIAGAIMWGFGGLALVVAAAALFAAWLLAMDEADRRAAERAGTGAVGVRPR
jgi:putative membrane protein